MLELNASVKERVSALVLYLEGPDGNKDDMHPYVEFVKIANEIRGLRLPRYREEAEIMQLLIDRRAGKLVSIRPSGFVTLNSNELAESESRELLKTLRGNIEALFRSNVPPKTMMYSINANRNLFPAMSKEDIMFGLDAIRSMMVIRDRSFVVEEQPGPDN